MIRFYLQIVSSYENDIPNNKKCPLRAFSLSVSCEGLYQERQDQQLQDDSRDRVDQCTGHEGIICMDRASCAIIFSFSHPHYTESDMP